MSSPTTPHPTLEPLAVLVGEWRMILSNASFLEDASVSFESSASFRWVQEGAYLLLVQGDPASPPYAYWMIGSDDAVETFTILYADDRRVSRVYHMSLADGVWQIWRNAPGFHQRFSGRLSEDGNTISARWENSEDGEVWNHDFDLTYKRII